jgi:periplasmic protein TonB
MSSDGQGAANQKRKFKTGETSMLNLSDKGSADTANLSGSKIPSLEDLDTLVSNLLGEAAKVTGKQGTVNRPKPRSSAEQPPARSAHSTAASHPGSSGQISRINVGTVQAPGETGLMDIEDRVLYQPAISPQRKVFPPLPRASASEMVPLSVPATESLQPCNAKDGSRELELRVPPTVQESGTETDSVPLFAPVAQEKSAGRRVVLMGVPFAVLAAGITVGLLYFGSYNKSRSGISNHASEAMNSPVPAGVDAAPLSGSMTQEAKPGDNVALPVAKPQDKAGAMPLQEANKYARRPPSREEPKEAPAITPQLQPDAKTSTDVSEKIEVVDKSQPLPVSAAESPEVISPLAPATTVSQPPAHAIEAPEEPAKSQIQNNAADLKESGVSAPARPVAVPVSESFIETQAVLVSRVLPRYPESAKRMNVSGSVRIEAVVDNKGKVIKATALDGPALLRGAAEEAVLKWRYSPASINGKPMASKVSVLISFSK